jgi:hypothetical protein
MESSVKKTVFDLLGRQYGWTRHDGLYGVEIETESLSSYDWPSMKFWDLDSDGSLRNFGVEYILKQPVNEEQLLEALDEFNELNYDFIEDSISTSVHVHYNVLNSEPIHVVNAITLYSILEPVLCKFAGPYRESNLFCLQLKDAEANLQNIKNMISAMDFQRTRSVQMKYAALNTNSFWDFGSVEFRALRGTTDTKLITDWAFMIRRIFLSGEKFKDPYEVVVFAQSETEKLLTSVFGDLSLQLEYDGWQNDCEMNMWFAYEIASFKDWGAFAIPKPKKIAQSEYDLLLTTKRKVYPDSDEEWIRNAVLRDCRMIYGLNLYAEEGIDFIFVPDEELTSDPANSEMRGPLNRTFSLGEF